jgi:hypothetical protein
LGIKFYFDESKMYTHSKGIVCITDEQVYASIHK